MHCSASADLDTAIPNWVAPVKDPDADNAANRGTKMHELFAETARLSAKDMRAMGEAIEYVGVLRQKRRFKALIEQEMTVEWLTTRPKTTADLVLYVADEIHIIDLKTGKIPVQAMENSQLMYYALTYGHLAPKAQGAFLHIVQPSADNIEWWYADAARLGLFMQQALAAEFSIQHGQLQFSPGDHCQFCPANPHSRAAKGRPYCPAMMQLLYPQPEPDWAEILVIE